MAASPFEPAKTIRSRSPVALPSDTNRRELSPTGPLVTLCTCALPERTLYTFVPESPSMETSAPKLTFVAKSTSKEPPDAQSSGSEASLSSLIMSIMPSANTLGPFPSARPPSPTPGPPKSPFGVPRSGSLPLGALELKAMTRPGVLQALVTFTTA